MRVIYNCVFAAVGFVAFVVLTAGIFAGLQQNAKNKNTPAVSTQTYMSTAAPARQVDAALLIEPAESLQIANFEEKRDILREHLLLSIQRKTDTGEHLVISPEWVLAVLDAATFEINRLHKTLVDAAHEKHEKHRPIITCPYTGQTIK